MSRTRRHTARHHEGADRTRLRRPHLEHCALDAQRIPRTHGPWPAARLKAGTDKAASGREITLDQQRFPLSLQAQCSRGQLHWPFVNLDAKIPPDVNVLIFS